MKVGFSQNVFSKRVRSKLRDSLSLCLGRHAASLRSPSINQKLISGLPRCKGRQNVLSNGSVGGHFLRTDYHKLQEWLFWDHWWQQQGLGAPLWMLRGFVVDKTMLSGTNRSGSSFPSHICRLGALWKIRKGTRLRIWPSGGLSILL